MNEQHEQNRRRHVCLDQPLAHLITTDLDELERRSKGGHERKPRKRDVQDSNLARIRLIASQMHVG